MNDNEKKIIGKLIKIATAQQKMLTKLAQVVDPNVATLKSAAEIAAMNLNSGAPININVTPAVAPEQGYKIEVKGLKDNKSKAQWKHNLDNHLNQRPETQKLLEGLVVVYL